MRATWLTDIHLDSVEWDRTVQLYADIAAERPDVLFVTGDIANACSVFDHLHALVYATRTQIYYVLGNHDYYGSSIDNVRTIARSRDLQDLARVTDEIIGIDAKWVPAQPPIRLTDHVVLVGVDGWGDARCGNLQSRVRLYDWREIQDFRASSSQVPPIPELRDLGKDEAAQLRSTLKRVPACKQLFVLTHVPPYPESCFYDGKQSEPDFLPWFTCVATGEVLSEYAQAHSEIEITVLCGHTHGKGTYQPEPNLIVRTGGWDPGVPSYGNPVVQATFEL